MNQKRNNIDSLLEEVIISTLNLSKVKESNNFRLLENRLKFVLERTKINQNFDIHIRLRVNINPVSNFKREIDFVILKIFSL